MRFAFGTSLLTAKPAINCARSHIRRAVRIPRRASVCGPNVELVHAAPFFAARAKLCALAQPPPACRALCGCACGHRCCRQPISSQLWLSHGIVAAGHIDALVCLTYGHAPRLRLAFRHLAAAHRRPLEGAPNGLSVRLRCAYGGTFTIKAFEIGVVGRHRGTPGHRARSSALPKAYIGVIVRVKRYLQAKHNLTLVREAPLHRGRKPRAHMLECTICAQSNAAIPVTPHTGKGACGGGVAH